MDDLLVTEAPEIETNVETSVADEPTGETSEVETTTDPTAEGTEETQEAAPPVYEPAIAGTKLSAAAKATLDEIHAKNPKLAAELKSALYEREALNQALPGGVKALKELQSTLESYGGLDGVQSLKQEAADWEALDQRFTSADPKFVDEIADASPEAFAKLAPSIFGKFQQISPDGFSKYLGEVFVNDMMQSNVPLMLERLQDFIGDNPKAQEIWKQLSGYVNRVYDLSRQEVKPIAAKEAAAPTIDADRQKFEQEKTEFTRGQWATAASTNRNQLFNAEWTRATTGLKLNSEQTAAIKELYVARLSAALKNTSEFNATIDKYFKAGDQQGYLRYIASIYKQQVPKALQTALNAVAPGRKPGPKPGTAAAPGQKAATTTATPGFVWTTTRPATDKIDFRFTTQSMILKGQAITKDGKKLQWKR